MTELLRSNTDNLVSAIQEAMKEGRMVDIYLILHRFATDVIAQFTYGPHGSTNSLGDSTYRDVAEQFALSDRRVYQLCQIHCPSLTKIWTQIVEVFTKTDKIGVMEYGWKAVQAVKVNAIDDPEESLASLMMTNSEKFSDAYIASELLDHLVRSFLV
jgi:hypothetical protein